MSRTVHSLVVSVGLIALASGCPVLAEAQPPPAATLAELAQILPVGQTVTVTDAAGSDITGRVTGLSPTSLTLAVESAARTFAEDGEHRAAGQSRPQGCAGRAALLTGGNPDQFEPESASKGRPWWTRGRQPVGTRGRAEVRRRAEAFDKKLDAIQNGTAAAPGLGPVNRDLARFHQMLLSGDARPSQRLEDSSAEACQALAAALDSWRRLNTIDLPAVNAALAQSTLAPLVAGAVPVAPSCAPKQPNP
jgi:hypothetical protein